LPQKVALLVPALLETSFSPFAAFRQKREVMDITEALMTAAVGGSGKSGK
jgi:hypothetical protein